MQGILLLVQLYSSSACSEGILTDVIKANLRLAGMELRCAKTLGTRIVRAAWLQNETAPEKTFNRYEKQFEKREKRSEKRSETRPKNV